jgi:fibronectin type 3 domain-containing protein
VRYDDQLSGSDFKRFVGGTFSYEVSSLTRGFRGRPIVSESSNRVRLTLVDVPQPVTALSIEPSQKALDLTWQAPAQTLTGRPAGLVESYRVYRHESGPGTVGKPEPFKPIGVTHGTTFADSDFEFGRLYSYRVRAQVSENGSTAESADSPPVEIMPKDVFPPAAPAGLTGLYTADAVELIWTPNLEPDLAGYNVYRREAGQQSVRLNSELVRSALYRDTTVTPGHHYFYYVTAEDLSGNESGPSQEVEVDVP